MRCLALTSLFLLAAAAGCTDDAEIRRCSRHVTAPPLSGDFRFTSDCGAGVDVTADYAGLKYEGAGCGWGDVDCEYSDEVTGELVFLDGSATVQSSRLYIECGYQESSSLSVQFCDGAGGCFACSGYPNLYQPMTCSGGCSATLTR